MSRISIRIQLLALMAAVAIPLVAILVYTIYSNAQQGVAEAKSSAHVLAVVAASDVTRILAANRDVLKQMAKRTLIRAVDGKHCDPVLWDFMGLFPKSANMTEIGLDGTAICSAVPQPGKRPVSIAKAEWFKRTLAENDLVVSRPFFGPITGRWVTVLTYPVLDDFGKKIAFLGLPLDLALYEPNLSGAPLIPGTSVVIQTGDGVIVWRNIDPEKWVGKNVAYLGSAQKLLAMKRGETEGVGLDGVNRFYAVTPVNGVDWVVLVGIPSESVYSRVRAALIRNILMGAISLMGFIGFAIFVARRIETPIKALALVARTVKNGNNDIRARLEGAPEIIEVAEEFNEMLDVRLNAEVALIKSESNLSDALKIARLGYWEYEVVSDEFIFNDQYYSLHHTTAKDMGGYRMSSANFCGKLVHPEDAPQVGIHIRKAIDTQDANFYAETEARIFCVDGDVRWVQVRFRIEKNEDGDTTRLIGANQDITERKKSEDELRALREILEIRVKERTSELETANKELEAFSYSVSHDLRTPLRAIDGFSRILLEDYSDKLDDEGKRLFNVVCENASRMGQLIDDILQFSRTGRLEINEAEIDMESLAHSVFDELNVSVDVNKLQVKIDHLPSVTGDRAMLHQVFVNLLSNAIKFSRTKALPLINVGGSIEGDEAVYFVKDNGVGFDMQYVDKLFGVFQRLHTVNEFEGTGIGLAIVKRIITRHGGRVWAVGKVDEGTTIYFTLPAKEKAAQKLVLRLGKTEVTRNESGLTSRD